jgi:hypothetical protein
MRNDKYSKTVTSASQTHRSLSSASRGASPCPIKGLSDNQDRTTAIAQARVTSLLHQDERTIGLLPERAYNRSHKCLCRIVSTYGTQQQGGSHDSGESTKMGYETGSNDSPSAPSSAPNAQEESAPRRVRTPRSFTCHAYPSVKCTSAAAARALTGRSRARAN